LSFASAVAQHEFRHRQLVENLLPFGDAISRLAATHPRQRRIGRDRDLGRVAFEVVEP
jgi:hypothetical protein